MELNWNYAMLMAVFVSVSGEPCSLHDTIDNWKRSVANGAGTMCDALLTAGWYRVISKSGELMPTECIHYGGRCGTGFPIWLNASYPDEGQIVNATVCTSDEYGECCVNSYEIQIKNCSSFYVYNLVSVFQCPQSYCFGSELPCPEGQTSDTGFTPGCKFDPCLQSNYIEIDNYKRSVSYNFESTICDAFLTSGWYRPVSEAGNMMPTECPVDGFTCGTTYPIWMNGTYPAVGDTANVTCCIVDPDYGCCSGNYNIQVKNCEEFYVYNLVTTSKCDTGYCFGKELPCPIGQTSNNGFTPGCRFDPCQNYTLIDEEYRRSSEFVLLNEVPIDDSTLNSGWYTFDSYVGNDLVNRSLELNRCGTIYPVWMIGDIPSDRSETVNRTCCVTGINNTCESTTSIQVRNCGEFRVYYLQQLEKSRSGYCVGSNPITTTTAENTMVHYSSSQEEPEQTVLVVIITIGVLSCILLVSLLVITVAKCSRKFNIHSPSVSCEQIGSDLHRQTDIIERKSKNECS